MIQYLLSKLQFGFLFLLFFLISQNTSHFKLSLCSQEGQRFTVREGHRTVGTGIVSKIIA